MISPFYLEPLCASDINTFGTMPFLPGYPFVFSFGWPYLFVENVHSCKGGSSTLFQGRLQPFFLYLFFPSYLCRRETATPMSRARPLSGIRLENFPRAQCMVGLAAYRILPLSFRFRPPCFPARCSSRLPAGTWQDLVPVGG